MTYDFDKMKQRVLELNDSQLKLYRQARILLTGKTFPTLTSEAARPQYLKNLLSKAYAEDGNDMNGWIRVANEQLLEARRLTRLGPLVN